MELEASKREELYEYQEQIGEQYVANVEQVEFGRWQNARRARKGHSDVWKLQETMDRIGTSQVVATKKTRMMWKILKLGRMK